MSFFPLTAKSVLIKYEINLKSQVNECFNQYAIQLFENSIDVLGFIPQIDLFGFESYFYCISSQRAILKRDVFILVDTFDLMQVLMNSGSKNESLQFTGREAIFMEDDKKVKKDSKKKGDRPNSKSGSSCFYLVDPCGCSVDLCGCYSTGCCC